MKESINFYYNLNIDDLESLDNIYRFKIKNDEFYFVPSKRVAGELEDIVNVSNELRKMGYPVHEIIFNKFGKIETNIYNQNYILLKPIQDIYMEYDLKYILNLNKKLTLTENKSKLYRNSWADLWSAKIDYFEYQISEIGKDKNIILDSFSYYIGLAENAISYVNSTNTKYKSSTNDKICLSHRRINFPNYGLNYFNPLSFIFDLEVRDIASFIKSSFFAGENALNYLKLVLKNKSFTIYSLSLLYARLLYPSYYFDIYEKIMNEEAEEENLIPIIEKSEEYEEFLKLAYLEISNYVIIERVEWLMNKK